MLVVRSRCFSESLISIADNFEVLVSQHLLTEFHQPRLLTGFKAHLNNVIPFQYMSCQRLHCIGLLENFSAGKFRAGVLVRILLTCSHIASLLRFTNENFLSLSLS